MALTPAERKRRSRERQALEAKLAGDPVDQIATVKFSDYVSEGGAWDGVLTYLDWAGFQPAPGLLETDDDPDHNPETDGPYRGSIGRAERMVSMFLDAATELAGIINTYKREQIDAAIVKLEASDLADPVITKRVLAEIVRLTKLREQLDKQVRRTLPEWKTKGG